MTTRSECAAIVVAVAGLGRSLGVDITAEGIEDATDGGLHRRPRLFGLSADAGERHCRVIVGPQCRYHHRIVKLPSHQHLPVQAAQHLDREAMSQHDRLGASERRTGE
jgi:hypothetical protein